MLTSEVVVTIPCRPHVASFIRAKFPQGITMNRKERFGTMLVNLATSAVKNKAYKLNATYSDSIEVRCSRNLIWRYGYRTFHPENVVRFNDMVDDDMLNELASTMNTLQVYEDIQQKDIILMFMDDYKITENSTFDKWRKAITRKKQFERRMSQSVQPIPNLSFR